MSSPGNIPSDNAPESRGEMLTASKQPGRSIRRIITFWAAISLGIAFLGLGAAQVGGGAAKQKRAVTPEPGSTGMLYAVAINRPTGPRQVATGLTNFHGEAVMASCSSCHATTKPNLTTRRSEDLDQFHQGLKYAHGDLSCLSCHNSENYETLRMADTRAVEFTDSMTLCSQCHGPQRRDYDRGLHGGMNGHWDLTKGGRTRNTCIDCHDPHAPAFPQMLPVLPPRDRISVPLKNPPANHSTAVINHE